MNALYTTEKEHVVRRGLFLPLSGVLGALANRVRSILDAAGDAFQRIATLLRAGLEVGGDSQQVSRQLRSGERGW